MKSTFAVVLLSSALAMPAANAQQSPAPTPPAKEGGSSASVLTDGEVRKVDKDAAKITVRHGEIKHLEMPAMTMVFQVKDRGMLDKVKAGDKVRFNADKVGGVYTITQIQTAN